MGLELQGTAVLGDGPNGLFGHALRSISVDLQGHLYVRADQAAQVLDHIFGHSGGVTPDPGLVQEH